MRKNLFDYLWVLRPTYWLMNEKYSSRWDARLLKLLSEHKFEKSDEYYAQLGNFRIWITNHPYASFQPRCGGLPNCRPRRSTISFARRRLVADVSLDADPYPRDEAEELKMMARKDR